MKRNCQNENEEGNKGRMYREEKIETRIFVAKTRKKNEEKKCVQHISDSCEWPTWWINDMLSREMQSQLPDYWCLLLIMSSNGGFFFWVDWRLRYDIEYTPCSWGDSPNIIPICTCSSTYWMRKHLMRETDIYTHSHIHTLTSTGTQLINTRFSWYFAEVDFLSQYMCVSV